MSFVITLYVREGIVMASDSRLTLNTQNQVAGQPTIMNVAVGMSDSNHKTFLAYNRFGISTFGQADMNGVPISGNIETFIRQQTDCNVINVNTFATRIKDFFRQYNPIPNTHFLVAGYETEEGILKQKVFNVNVNGNSVTRANPENASGEIQGAQWGGETDILMRILQPIFLEQQQPGGQNTYQALPHFGIPFQFFTLQDAIDFSVYAIQTTIDTIKFQPRAKTVGGPIDVLVIKPTECIWVSRKHLKI
jgi:hypothetical protein